jgi:hypothetical protein
VAASRIRGEAGGARALGEKSARLGPVEASSGARAAWRVWCARFLKPRYDQIGYLGDPLVSNIISENALFLFSSEKFHKHIAKRFTLQKGKGLG